MCGLPGALSVIVRVAVRAPELVGANTTSIVQLEPGMWPRQPQPSCTRKSPGCAPASATCSMLSGAVPELETVTARGELMVPAACDPKSSSPALMPIAGTRPTPDSGSRCGEPSASLVTTR